MEKPIVADYLIETSLPVEQAAGIIAGEQSSGTFLKVPGETEELKARAGARVTAIKPVEVVDAPSLPGARQPKGATGSVKWQRARITIEFPFDNLGANLPTLVATLCGNLYELSEHSGCKLMDLELPDAFARKYLGPAFGIEGTRKLAGVFGRPMIGTIIKPSVGLSPAQTADLVRSLAEAGIDFIKDDELMADPPHSPLKERVVRVLTALDEVAQKTGRKAMYAFNITDDLEQMLRHQELIRKAGGTCVMVSIHSVGLPAVIELRKRAQLPIHGHRNGWGMYTRHPLLGVSYTAWQKLWRLAGVDHLHVNGIQNKFWEDDDSVVQSIKACMTPLFPAPGPAHIVMPVISSGQWGGQAPETYRRTQTVDVMYLAGGGIMAHPSGPAAGLKALQQAWAAAVKGIPLAHHAETHPELKETIAKFGGIRG